MTLNLMNGVGNVIPYVESRIIVLQYVGEEDVPLQEGGINKGTTRDIGIDISRDHSGCFPLQYGDFKCMQEALIEVVEYRILRK